MWQKPNIESAKSELPLDLFGSFRCWSFHQYPLEVWSNLAMDVRLKTQFQSQNNLTAGLPFHFWKR